jgi:pimeloyl-ACP methyl ester carboxylesterase
MARIDIGVAQLEAVVAGDGPVAVVFESGLGTTLESWDAVASSLAVRTRTVCYNRRRAAASGTVAPRTSGDMVSDLRALLAGLAVGPPYVLVGHSWGGVVARTFAHAYPADVAGLVLVDATHEVVDSRGFALLPIMYGVMGMAARFGAGRRWLLAQICPPSASPAYRALVEQRVRDRSQWRISLRTARAEGAGIRASLAALTRDCPELPAVPVYVLTAGGVRGPNLKQVQRVHAAWKAMVERAPNASYTNVPNGGHQMPIEVPGAVIAAVTDVLDRVGAERG